MGPWLLALVALIYFFVSYDLYTTGKYGMSLAFLAYGVSNIGLIWAILS